VKAQRKIKEAVRKVDLSDSLFLFLTPFSKERKNGLWF